MAGDVVIGGGITGAAAAYHLARNGRRVRLFEARRVAAMASGWTLGGVRQSGRDAAELPMARLAVERWAGLAEELGYETGYQRFGNIRLARSPEEVETIRHLVDGQSRQGLQLFFLEGNERVRQVAPAVSESVIAASFCPSDGFADPLAATQAYARAAKLYGAKIEEGVAVRSIVMRAGRVAGVETQDGFVPADSVILAAGTHSPALLRPLGLDLPLRVSVVHSVLTVAQPRAFDQVFGVANADCAGRQQPDGRFRFTGGIGAYVGDHENWNENALAPTPQGVAELRARVRKVLPLAGAVPVAKSWGGLIDLTPDGLPVIDAPMNAFGLVIAAGFSGHGFGIAPVTGQIAAELSMRTKPILDVSAFRLERFRGMSPSAATLTLHG